MNKKDVITLKEFFTILLDERDKRIYQRFEAMDKAVTELKQTTEKRFENANEWRNSYDDLVRTYIPRSEFDIFSKKVEKIENVKQGGNQAWLILVAGVGLLIGFLGIVLAFIK